MSKNKENKIQIDEIDYSILKEILNKYPYRFYVYGSRAKGTAAKYSDIDIFCDDKIRNQDMTDISTEIEESDITVKVDIIDVHSCSWDFMKTIEKDLVEIR